MSWIQEIIFGNSVAHCIFAIAITISLGILLGKVKIAGISLGITWILFSGIFFSHFGIRLPLEVSHFTKELGLVLFVYAIGLQVGPSFFSSFKKGGISLNLLATSIVLLGCVTTYIIHCITGIDLSTMVGILSGAVTNTPSLGAAQQTYADAVGSSNGVLSTIASGYAVAYPLGVIGIIIAIIVFRSAESRARFEPKKQVQKTIETKKINVKVTNKGVIGRSLNEVSEIINRNYVVARIMHEDGSIEVGSGEILLKENDILRIRINAKDVSALVAFIGERVSIDASIWEKEETHLVSRRIVVTKEKINGQRLGDLHIENIHEVNVTRINRAGVDILATPDLKLQIGDRVNVVGKIESVDKLADILGNSMKRLDIPNIFPIFLGLVIGVLFGSLPIFIPGMPIPVKLGLAGGPLIVAILIGRFGPFYKMITFTTTSANMMLREISISLFLAAVGLSAGENFVQTLTNGGYWWILLGFIITILPLLIVGFVALRILKMDSMSIAGLLSGSMTDPPALAFSNSINSSQENSGNASVAYATVYPLTMFLRILLAQILILMAI